MLRSEKPEIVNFREDYATRADFCEMLDREFKSFYLLAFLLTANHQQAEACFAATTEAALKEQAVFRGWARSWIKRSLIKNAIHIATPLLNGVSEKRDFWNGTQDQSNGDDEINAVAQLAPLERIVFIMSVLERYSIWNCSVLLGRSTSKVIEARIQALRALPGPVICFPRIGERNSRLQEVPRMTFSL
jgi:DNA-directed RNA polymerase specialized sigma24 family protein